MQIEYLGALVQNVQNIGQGIVALLPIIVVPVGLYKVVQWSFSARAGLGKLTGNLTDRSKNLTQKARDRAQQTNMYQRPQMARDFRKQERRRANVEDYAQRVTESPRWRRRAAGIGNAAGQQRALQSAQEVLRKQRHEEADRAAQRMKDAGFRGDNDYLRIATADEGATLTSASGQQMRVTHADRQAAINNLVQQGRTSEIRRLEGFDSVGTPIPRAMPGAEQRGANGAARTDLHQMLDHAYEDYGSKLGDKAPDLLPDRRTTGGVAAFTDLKPGDVSKWHHSTMAAAQNYYNTVGTDQQRDQMLRSLAQATQAPSTRSELSLDQMTRAVDILNDARASGIPVDPIIAAQIEDTFHQLGG